MTEGDPAYQDYTQRMMRLYDRLPQGIRDVLKEESCDVDDIVKMHQLVIRMGPKQATEYIQHLVADDGAKESPARGGASSQGGLRPQRPHQP